MGFADFLTQNVPAAWQSSLMQVSFRRWVLPDIVTLISFPEPAYRVEQTQHVSSIAGRSPGCNVGDIVHEFNLLSILMKLSRQKLTVDQYVPPNEFLMEIPAWR